MGETTEQFERDRTAYEQNFEQFRDLNRLMWQVPMLAITITGGFWYAALAVVEMTAFARSLFLMCAALDLALILVLVRIRFVMSRYLDQLRAFNPKSFVEAKSNNLFFRGYVVVCAFCFALFVAAILSLVMAFWPGILKA